MRRKIGITILIVFGLAVISGLGFWWFWSKGNKGPGFRTAAVKRGDIVATISATGTVEPEEVVDVGTRSVEKSRPSARIKTERSLTTLQW